MSVEAAKAGTAQDTEKELSAGKGLLSGLGSSWHLGTWVRRAPTIPGTRKGACPNRSVWFQLSASFPSGGLEFQSVRDAGAYVTGP